MYAVPLSLRAPAYALCIFIADKRYPHDRYLLHAHSKSVLLLAYLSRYCVCYIHEEFNRLLQVLKKDSVVSHENCDCTCPFCIAGNCRCVLTSDLDLYWFMRHMMCTPSKLHSKTSRNLFPPRCNPFTYFLSLLHISNVTLSCPVSVVWKVGAPQNPPAFLVALIRFFSAPNLDCSQMTLSHLNSASTKT